MAVDLGLVFESFHPCEAVRVGPDWVVDPAEIHIELASAFFEEVGQKDGHFVVAERVFLGPLHVVPLGDARRADWGGGFELVHAVAGSATLSGHGAGEHVQEEQTAGNLPATHVACPRGPPVVGGKLGGVLTNHFGNFSNGCGVNAGLLLGGLGGVLGVLVQHGLANRRPLNRKVRTGALQVGLPVGPALDEGLVPVTGFDQQPGDGQQQERFGTGPGRQPEVGLGARVGKARVNANYLCPIFLGLHDPLGMGIEVVAGFKVGRDQENDFGVSEV